MMNQDITEDFLRAIEEAHKQKTKLSICGAGSKAFYGNPVEAKTLSTLAHQGVLSYEPSELCITARSGTPLRKLEQILAEKNQQLAFEPPRFGEHGGTVGGMVACGLAGPARATHGTVRDFVLGCKLMNGKGEVMSFGGQVMKNVAGYDIARMMAGSMGTLALLLEVSLKVLPKPKHELTLLFEMPQEQALLSMNRWAAMPLPISATWWHAGHLSIRLKGAESTLKQSVRYMGGQVIEATVSKSFWQTIRDQTHPFFQLHPEEWLWRIQVPSTCSAFASQSIEYNGHLRWTRTGAHQQAIKQVVSGLNGQTTLYRIHAISDQHKLLNPNSNNRPNHVFTPLTPTLAKIQSNIRKSFDPHNLFAAERLFSKKELVL